MIRRDLDPQGSPQWLIISQVDHAHLAAAVAEHWSLFGDSLSDRAREPLIRAAFHHDDGWAEWDRKPRVDPTRGKPVAFNEMALGDSLAIWRKSIAGAAELGDLEAYAVAGHFCALLRRFDSWRTNASLRPLAVEFFAEIGCQMALWSDAWRRQCQSSGIPTGATAPDETVAYVQLFDALSLWLCCAEQNEPHSLDTPAETVVTFTPIGPGEIKVSPWPLNCRELKLEVSGRAVAARHYADADDLAQAPGSRCTISWHLAG